MSHKQISEIEARTWFRANTKATANLDETFSRFTVTTWSTDRTTESTARVVYHSDDQTYWYLLSDGNPDSLKQDHLSRPRHR